MIRVNLKTTHQDFKDQLLFHDKNNFPFPWPYKEWKNIFTMDQYFLEGLVSEQKLVAWAIWTLNVDQAHLLKMFVQPQWRRKGFGMALLQNQMNIIRQIGISHFYLEVQSSNQAAINLYQNVGFHIIHTKKHFYSNGEDAFIMIYS